MIPVKIRLLKLETSAYLVILLAKLVILIKIPVIFVKRGIIKMRILVFSVLTLSKHVLMPIHLLNAK